MAQEDHSPGSDSIPIADLSTPTEFDTNSEPLADLSETRAAQGPGSEATPVAMTATRVDSREAETEELRRGDRLDDARDLPEPAEETADETPQETADETPQETADEAPQDPPLHAPPQKTNGWIILAPVLVAPVLVGVLLLLGLPQHFFRSLSGTDLREPNDTIAEAMLLEPGVATGMRCGHGDVDWYRIHIPPGKCLQLKTEPPPSSRGTTSIHGLDGRKRVETPFGEIRCVYAPEGLQAETVLVRVWGERAIPYQIDVGFLDPGVRYEPNNNPTDATPIQLGRHERLTCNGSDWYLVEIPAWRPLTASLDTQASGLGLRTLPTTFDIASVTSASLTPTQTIPALGAPRSLYVEVQGSGDYTLDLQLGATQRPVKASTAPGKVFKGAFEPNQTKEAAQPLEVGVYPELRCDGKDWYSIEVPANTTFSAKLRHSLRYGDLQLRLEDEKPSVIRYAQQHDDIRRARFYAQKATRVYLLVEGGNLPYRLTLEMSPGFPGVLLDAGDYKNLVCAPSQVWRVPVQEGQKIEVELDYDAGTAWLNLVLYDLSMSNAGPSSSGSGRATRSFVSGSDQPMFIEVRGSQSARYQLKITLSKAEGISKDFDPFAHIAGPGVYPKRKLVSEAYYALLIRESDHLSVEARFDSEQGDIDLELIDQKGQTLTAQTGSETFELLDYTSTTQQLAYLRVFTYHPATLDYDLTISVNGKARPQAERVTPPLTREVTKNNGMKVYRVALLNGETLSASIQHDPADGQLGLWLQDSNGRLVSEVETKGATETLTYTATVEGDVFLRVRGSRAPFTLTLSKESP